MLIFIIVYNHFYNSNKMNLGRLVLLASMLLMCCNSFQLCPNVPAASDKQHKKKVGSFYTALLGSDVSFTNVIKTAVDKEISAEALIQLVDKDNNCKMSKEELIGFLRRWAEKKHMTLSI